MMEKLQDLNFLHLFYFWMVVRHRGITAACELLHLTQPTISTQIRKLEKSLGQELFDRSGRELELTAVGKTVYEYADEMFAVGRELLGALRGMPSTRAMRLMVGMPMVMQMLGGGETATAEMHRLIGTGGLDATGYGLLGVVVITISALCMLTSRFGVFRILNAKP